MPSAPQRESRQPTLETPPALVGRWLVDEDASHARFVSGSLAGLVKTAGRFRSLSGHLVVARAQAAGALVIETSSIDTGNRMRDLHLRSRGFFDVKRHPQIRYEPHWISDQDPGKARIAGELIVGNTRTPLQLDVALHTPVDGVVELVCRTEVDRVALGIRAARGMVPRAVELDIWITLRQRLP